MAILPEKRKKKARKSQDESPSGGSLPVVRKYLDGEEVRLRFSQVQEWFRQSRLAHAENRHQMAIDQDFYDGLQWTEEDKAILNEREQAPLVFNLISTTIRWISGTEKRTRIDYRVLPRKAEDSKGTEVKTALLKYLSDVNREGFKRSSAFMETIVVGVSWLEEGIKSDPEDEPLYVRTESWRNMWIDPLSKEPDLSDCRFLFRSKWVDLDIAQAMFPHRKDELAAACDSVMFENQMNEEQLYDNPWLYGELESLPIWSSVDDANGMGTRKRVRLVECWYKEPGKYKVLRGEGTFNNSLHDPTDPIHQWAIENQLATTHDALRMQMRCMIFAGGVVCQDVKSPYWHNGFPFTPVWCYRRGRDHAPYGVVRGIRDPQEDYNKRRSKALHLLSTRGIVADDDAVKDWNETLEELKRPDYVIRKKKGSELRIETEANFAQAHVNLMDQDARLIQEVGGITDENLGRQTNATSGIAIEARQNQGFTTTADIFDNLRLAIQLSGEKQLALIEQFYDQDKILRITGERKAVKFMEIKRDPDTGLNQIVAAQADYVVDEQDYRGTVRQAMFETIMEMSSKLPPEIGLKLLALGFEMSDVPMRDEFVKVLREITGMQGPEDENDPEKQAQIQQQQAAQAQQAAQDQAQAQAVMQAQLQKIMAEATLIENKAKEAAAKGDEAQIKALLTKLDALAKSMDLAGQVSVAPELSQAADGIIQSIDAAKSVSPPVNNVVANNAPITQAGM